jgi:hypothetical protein
MRKGASDQKSTEEYNSTIEKMKEEIDRLRRELEEKREKYANRL